MPSPRKKADKSRAGPRPAGLYQTLLQAMTMMTGLTRQGLSIPDHVVRRAEEDMQQFLAGVDRYHKLPWRRKESPLKKLAGWGRVSLLVDAKAPKKPRGTIVLVPSMVNRWYVFDLLPEASLLSFLRQQGYQVMVVDWGDPEQSNDRLTLDKAIADRLVPAFSKARVIAGEPLTVCGYCMGGVMTLAAVQRVGENVVGRLACIASPWDFSRTEGYTLTKLIAPFYDSFLAAMPLVPVDIMAGQFAALDPFGVVRRLQAFAAENDDGQLRRLAAIEDWLADGVAMENDIARAVLHDWYVENLPVKGEWKVAGVKVDPAKLTQPVLIVAAERDTLVSPASALALAEQVKHPTVIRVPSGHIGLMVGRRAVEKFYRPFIDWVQCTTKTLSPDAKGGTLKPVKRRIKNV